MKENLDIHSLAVRYFEGRVSGSEESCLYDYVKADKENYMQFKTWEREWLRSTKTDEAIEDEWKELQNRMRIRGLTQRIVTNSRRMIWRKVAAAIVIIVVSVGATVGIWTSTQNLRPEEYFTFVSPCGQRSKVVLSDGTVVWLNAGSTLQYSNRFNDSNRRVELKGEGYFEVTKKEGKLFTVATSGYDVVVKGTKFNVSAYPDESNITTTLIVGRVELQHQGKVIPMSPGETLSMNRSSGEFHRKVVNAEHAKLWSDGQLVFDHITLNELATKLSRQYNVDIKIQSPSLGDKAFRISILNKETIGEVMAALQKLQPFKVERKGRNIYIRE